MKTSKYPNQVWARTMTLPLSVRIIVCLLAIGCAGVAEAKPNCFQLHSQNSSRSFKPVKKLIHIDELGCEDCDFKDVKRKVRSRKVTETTYVIVDGLQSVYGQEATLGFEKSVAVGPGYGLNPEVGHFINVGVEEDGFYDDNLFGLDVDISWSIINEWRCRFERFCDKRYANDGRRRKRCERQWQRVPANRAVNRRFKNAPLERPFFNVISVNKYIR